MSQVMLKISTTLRSEANSRLKPSRIGRNISKNWVEKFQNKSTIWFFWLVKTQCRISVHFVFWVNSHLWLFQTHLSITHSNPTWQDISMSSSSVKISVTLFFFLWQDLCYSFFKLKLEIFGLLDQALPVLVRTDTHALQRFNFLTSSGPIVGIKKRET